MIITLYGVSSRLCAQDGEVDVGLPAVDDGVGLLARLLGGLLSGHDHLKMNLDKAKIYLASTFNRLYFKIYIN